MAKKKTADTTPGIYVRPKKQMVPATVDNLQAVLAKLEAEMDIDVQLQRIEDLALQLVRAAGGRDRWPFRVPKDADERARRATQVLRHIALTRRAIEQREARNAAIHAFYVGHMSEQVDVMRFDPLVKTGRKVHGGGDKAGRWQRATRAERVTQVLTRLAEVQQAHPDWSPTRIRTAVAREFHIHLRTVLRYLEKK